MAVANDLQYHALLKFYFLAPCNPLFIQSKREREGGRTHQIITKEDEPSLSLHHYKKANLASLPPWKSIHQKKNK